MRTLTRANLPQQINYNNKVYKCDFALSSNKMLNNSALLPDNCIKVNILKSCLKGKKDVFGKAYQPSVFIFLPQ